MNKRSDTILETKLHSKGKILLKCILIYAMTNSKLVLHKTEEEELMINVIHRDLHQVSRKSSPHNVWEFLP